MGREMPRHPNPNATFNRGNSMGHRAKSMGHSARSLRDTGFSILLLVIAATGFAVADRASGELGRKGPSSAEQGTVSATPAPQLRTAPAAWLGRSGRLRAVIDTEQSLYDQLAADSLDVAASVHPGLHDLGLVTPGGDPFYVVSLLPYGEKEGSTLRGYRIGSWPRNSTAERYAPPAGFIEVTRENEATPVSQSFKLQDFLTHDQAQVWPKYLVLKPRLLDKLELISAALAERGLPSRLHVMSGFRTPQYNEQGVGEKGGRASMSRHMYGDAADVFVDADGNGTMDDLNGDGRVTVADARVLFDVAESVEATNPDLVGGLSPYRANSAHGPFVHVDARGVKARW
jgi:hypothetical protein